MATKLSSDLVSLDLQRPIWSNFFSVAPLVVVGTREPNGDYDLAPKHMVCPLGWEAYFGFVCTPRHATYRNIQREGVFTVSFPRPEQVVLASLTASPRCEDTKEVMRGIPTVPAQVVEGVLLEQAYLFLECELDRFVDGFGENSLIAGRIVAARVDRQALRSSDRDDQEVVAENPLLAYLHPDHFAEIRQGRALPLPAGLRR